MSLVTRDRPARVSIRPVSFSLYGMQCGNNSLLIANDYNHQNEVDMEILDCNYFTCLNLCCFGRVASSPPWSWSETFQTNFGRVIDTDKTRRAPVKMVWKDVIREEKSLCPCNHTQRESVASFYRGAPMPAAPAPICCNRWESWGYFSDTSSCVRVASAYDRAFTISPSVLESSAARSKYFKASVTLPCWSRSWAIVATAISHSGSTANLLAIFTYDRQG